MKTTILYLILSFLITQDILSQKLSNQTNKQALEILPIRAPLAAVQNYSVKPYNNFLGVSGIIDTLNYGEKWSTNFGFLGQDIMLMWFEAPADIEIEAVGFDISDYEGRTVGVKIVDVIWTKEQIQATIYEIGDRFLDSYWGYYESDYTEFNAIAFLDDPKRSGDWIEASQTSQQRQWGSPFGHDIWSDQGNYILKEIDPDDGTDRYWMNMNLLGSNPVIEEGKIFGIAIKNFSGIYNSKRIGIYADTSPGYTGFKYYAEGRAICDPTCFNIGWFTRIYSWNITKPFCISDLDFW